MNLQRPLYSSWQELPMSGSSGDIYRFFWTEAKHVKLRTGWPCCVNYTNGRRVLPPMERLCSRGVLLHRPSRSLLMDGCSARRCLVSDFVSVRTTSVPINM